MFDHVKFGVSDFRLPLMVNVRPTKEVCAARSARPD